MALPPHVSTEAKEATRKQMAGTNPAIAIPNAGLARLLQRLDLDDRGAVVVADPEHRPRPGLLDEDAADVGCARQEIFGDLAALGVKPGYVVVRHRAGPHVGAALAGHDVVRFAPCLRQLELLHLLGRWIEHADGVPAILREPELALVVEPATPRPRARRARRPDLDLAGLAIAHADAVAAELQHVDIVVLVGRVAIAADLAGARACDAEVFPFAGLEIEAVMVAGRVVAQPDLVVDIH